MEGGRFAMTIKIRKAELEALIQERMKTGGFQNVEDALIHALKSSGRSEAAPSPRKPKQNLAQFLLDSPLCGSCLQLDRQKDYPRPVEL
jgi:hypothetical protein